MMKETLLQLLFGLVSFMFLQANANSVASLKPLPLLSLRTKPNQQQASQICLYTVVITTSCSSTSYTRDLISLSFGDAFGNQVYVPRLEDPSTRTFERGALQTRFRCRVRARAKCATRTYTGGDTTGGSRGLYKYTADVSIIVQGL